VLYIILPSFQKAIGGIIDFVCFLNMKLPMLISLQQSPVKKQQQNCSENQKT